MFSLLFALFIVVLGVCVVNISSLNLTENEERLLYVSDNEDITNTESNKTEVNNAVNEDVSIELVGDEDTDNDVIQGFSGNIGSVTDSFSKDFEKDLDSGIWDNLCDEFNISEEDSITSDDALDLTEKIYRGD